MLGNMTPREILALTKDKELEGSDVSEWVERTLREEATVLVGRLDRYKDRIQNRFGFMGSIIEKLVIYPRVWTNWDGTEPFAWREEEKPIKEYFDINLPANRT